MRRAHHRDHHVVVVEHSQPYVAAKATGVSVKHHIPCLVLRGHLGQVNDGPGASWALHQNRRNPMARVDTYLNFQGQTEGAFDHYA
jgi:uncharacterized glyoxalase superfamily protein PhnB